MDDEAIIIGGGPAGLSSAIGVAKAGFRVKLFEQKIKWSGRVCGAFLSPEAASHLDWLGVLNEIKARGAVEMTRVLVSDCYGRDRQLSLNNKGHPALAFPRKELEETLLMRAKSLGVQVQWGTRATRIYKDQDASWIVQSVNSGENRNEIFKCAVIICADGRFSAFGKSGKNLHKERKEGWLGFNAEFRDASVSPGDLSLHFFPKGYVGFLTFKNGLSNVSGLIHSDWKNRAGKRWETILHGILEERFHARKLLKNAVQCSSWIGVGALPFGRSFQNEGGPILAGDSAGVSDPYLGEGIGRALGSGPLLFKLFQNKKEALNNLPKVYREYNKAWIHRYRPRFQMGSLLRMALRNQWLLSKSIQFVSSSARFQRSLLPHIYDFQL